MRLFWDVDNWVLTDHDRLLAWLMAEARRENILGEVDIVFTNDESISRLNESFLSHDGPTDVIAFSFLEDDEEFIVASEESSEESDSGTFPAGEVYVSLDRAVEQARQYSVTITEEVSRLMLHGVLHLAGWDDATDEDRTRMAEREDTGLERAREGGDTIPWQIHPEG